MFAGVTSSDPPARNQGRGRVGEEEQWPRRRLCLPAQREQDSPVTSGATCLSD